MNICFFNIRETAFALVLFHETGTDDTGGDSHGTDTEIGDTDRHDPAEIFVDKRFADKSVEEMEEAEQVTIFLILRVDLSILPQKDTMLKINDIIVIRGENP